jgi:CspA family cold shock protein
MTTGTVKWWDDARGYGFVRHEDGSEFFVHHTEIQAAGFRFLDEGDRVQFLPALGPRGLFARQVRKLERVAAA